jgi:hypothetical protein
MTLMRNGLGWKGHDLRRTHGSMPITNWQPR